MNRRSSVFGIILIMIGLSVFFKNSSILPNNFIVFFGGIFLLYLWYLKRQSVFFILGMLGVVSGIISLLEYNGIFNFRFTAEMMLILLGIIFLYFYYSKDIFGFIFPGAIFISLAGYTILMRYFKLEKLWPSFFILLGFAFCFIHFAAYYGKRSWTLVLGVMLNILGIIFMAFSFGILNWRIYKYYNYLLPLIFIIVGFMMLMSVFRRNH